MTPRPTEQLDFGIVRNAYDEGAEDLAARFRDVGVEAPLDLAMVDAFARAVLAGDDTRVLDAGCGGGRMSRYLVGQGCLVEGIDLSPEMISTARRDHPDLVFTVGSLSDLPYGDDEFAGVMLWYSIIHTPPAGLTRLFTEVTRVLRPAGYVLVGFQSGEGTRKVAWAYERGIRLDRHLYTADHVASQLKAGGLTEVARLVRRARGDERDDQSFLLMQAVASTAST
ncbi:MAG: methyltransferase domain-containing protein [Actinomycetota bacterium]|nr:methyltransferase domain-containing protein [Actinomycetota bacterium]